MSIHTNKSQMTEEGSPRLILGSVALYSGVGLLGLLLVDSAYGLSLPLPRSWYVDRPIWSGISLPGASQSGYIDPQDGQGTGLELFVCSDGASLQGSPGTLGTKGQQEESTTGHARVWMSLLLRSWKDGPVPFVPS